jgi:hypothetical protein
MFRQSSNHHNNSRRGSPTMKSLVATTPRAAASSTTATPSTISPTNTAAVGVVARRSSVATPCAATNNTAPSPTQNTTVATRKRTSSSGEMARTAGFDYPFTELTLSSDNDPQRRRYEYQCNAAADDDGQVGPAPCASRVVADLKLDLSKYEFFFISAAVAAPKTTSPSDKQRPKLRALLQARMPKKTATAVVD